MTPGTKILVVDDEEHITELVSLYLKREGASVTCIKDGSDAFDTYKRIDPDLVVLDVMLPGEDGFTLCRKIRESSQVPILILSAKDDITDKVVGLELGADDYLTKPFYPQELVARVKSLLRRMAPDPNNSKKIVVGGLEINVERHSVDANNKELKLRPKEYDLLLLLASHPSKVYTREILLDLVWGYDFPGYTRTVDVHIQQLRQKFAAVKLLNPTIETVWGVGYRMDALQAKEPSRK